MFQRTTAINKLKKLHKRIKVIPGGTSAGKTFGITPILIDKAIKTPNLEISIVSESVPHLRRGAMKDFLKIMKDINRYADARWHGTNLVYTFSNNSYIEFFSADQPEKVRGPRRNILFINEANNLSWQTYYDLSIRTDQEIWIDFNPTNEFWSHTELQDDEDAEWLTLTYKDNEGLPQSLVTEIEKALVKAFYNPAAPDVFSLNNIKSRYWANWWKVYGLGLLGVLEGVVFTNWKQIEGIPVEAEYLGSGMDFGYTNHPTAITDFYRWNNTIIWDEQIYLTGLKNKDIAMLLKQQGKTKYSRIVADSAEPKSIDEVNEFGFSVEGAEKGPDSISFGIDLIQQENFLVTKNSTNVIKELRRYTWDTDKQGKPLNKPVDAFNHAIDGARYFYTRYISRKNKKDMAPVKQAFKLATKYFS